MSPDFEAFLAASQERSETSLEALLGDAEAVAALQRLYQASRYSLLNGGKRVRPMLVYAAAQAVSGSTSHPALDSAAGALEMVHVYSLVHDDLPAMDDDDLRRGKPSCHRAFDEATAILVGDGLQARAFEVLCDAPALTAESRLALVRMLAAAAGPRGMVGGQAIDVAATDSDLDLDALCGMHRRKTGALIEAGLLMGATCVDADEAQLAALRAYGEQVGLAFQVADDILDEAGETATLGKTRGKDAGANKATYVKLMGLAGARAEARRLQQAARGSLSGFGEQARPLRELADYIVQRSS